MVTALTAGCVPAPVMISPLELLAGVSPDGSRCICLWQSFASIVRIMLALPHWTSTANKNSTS